MKDTGALARRSLRSLFLAALLAAPSAFAATDEEIIAAFKKDAARIQAAMAAADADMERVHALQTEMKTLLDQTLGQVGDQTRPALQIAMKILNPVMEDGMRYTQLVQSRVEARVFDYPSATTTEEIDRRLKSVDELIAFNADLAKRISGLEAEVEKTLKESKLSLRDRAAFLDGYRKSNGRRIGAQKAVRTLDANVYDEVRSVYALLKDQMGKWSVADGQVTFQDDAHAESYNKHLARIDELSARQQKAIEKAMGVETAPGTPTPAATP